MLSTSQASHIFVRTVGTLVVRAWILVILVVRASVLVILVVSTSVLVILVVSTSMLVILQISIVGTLSTLVTSGDIPSEILLVRASMLVILQISMGECWRRARIFHAGPVPGCI